MPSKSLPEHASQRFSENRLRIRGLCGSTASGIAILTFLQFELIFIDNPRLLSDNLDIKQYIRIDLDLVTAGENMACR